jgi:hypothetical protein
MRKIVGCSREGIFAILCDEARRRELRDHISNTLRTIENLWRSRNSKQGTQKGTSTPSPSELKDVDDLRKCLRRGFLWHRNNDLRRIGNDFCVFAPFSRTTSPRRFFGILLTLEIYDPVLFAMGMAHPFFRPSHVPKEYADALVKKLAKHENNMSGVAKELETVCLTILTNDGRVSVPCGENFSFHRGKSGDGSSPPSSSSSASPRSAAEKATSLSGGVKTVKLSPDEDEVVYTCGEVHPRSVSKDAERDDMEYSDNTSSSEFDPGTCADVLPRIREPSPNHCRMSPQGIPLTWFLMRLFLRDKEHIDSKHKASRDKMYLPSVVRVFFSDFFKQLGHEGEDISRTIFDSKESNVRRMQRFDNSLAPLQKGKLISCELSLEQLGRGKLLTAICQDLTNAVFCLHSRGIAHGDIKTQNIVMNCVNSRWRAVLVDLDTRVHFDTAGQARPLERRQLVLTPWYATSERVSFSESAFAALKKDRFALHRLYERRAPTTYCAICADLVAMALTCVGINWPLRSGLNFEMSLTYPQNWQGCTTEVVKNHWDFFVKLSQRHPTFWLALIQNERKTLASFQASMHNHRPSSDKISDGGTRFLEFWTPDRQRKK